MDMFLIWLDLGLIIAVVATVIRQFIMIKRERAEAAAEIRRKRVAASGFRVIK